MPIILFGIFAEAVLGVFLLRTGRGALIWAMVGVLVLVLVGVGVERLVVTETEEVEAVLYDAAAALQANDEQAVLACCAESAQHTRSEARRALALVEFTQVKITKLQIKIIPQASPPMATAHFTVVVAGRARQDPASHERCPVRGMLKLRREPSGWRIIDHDLDSAPGGF